MLSIWKLMRVKNSRDHVPEKLKRIVVHIPVSVSPGTPKLSELSLINASVELVNVCGDNVKS